VAHSFPKVENLKIVPQ